jgi:8-oxo-dGTP diphosphatase
MNTLIGCSIVIYDDMNRTLIAQRSMSKKFAPLMWETVGGRLEEDEITEACIRRETLEEIGCRLKHLKLFKVYVIKESENRHVLIVFTGQIEGEPKLNEEIETIQWIRKAEIENILSIQTAQ